MFCVCKKISIVYNFFLYPISIVYSSEEERERGGGENVRGFSASDFWDFIMEHSLRTHTLVLHLYVISTITWS